MIIEHYTKNRKIIKDTRNNVFRNFTVPSVCECGNHHGGCVKHVLSGKKKPSKAKFVEFIPLNV